MHDNFSRSSAAACTTEFESRIWEFGSRLDSRLARSMLWQFCFVWRDGRVAEGGGLLNRYTVKSRIGGSNPPLSAIPHKTIDSKGL